MTLRTRNFVPLVALVTLAFLVLTGSALGQRPTEAEQAEMMRRMQDPAMMQHMAEQAEAMQACMKDVDRKQLDALQAKATAASREIRSLCDAGKRDQALSRAMKLAGEMRGNPTVKKMQECTKGMSEMMMSMPWAQVPGVADDSEPTESDICDHR